MDTREKATSRYLLIYEYQDEQGYEPWFKKSKNEFFDSLEDMKNRIEVLKEYSTVMSSNWNLLKIKRYRIDAMDVE